jgi:hypothetical protein
MKIGFTGNRKGFTFAQNKTMGKLFTSLSAQKIEEAHHGDCVGSDLDFHFFVRNNLKKNVKIVVHPPCNSTLRAFCPGDKILDQKDYLVRNKDIVEQSDLIIATPAESKEKLRSGTWSTIRTARKYKKPLIIVFPDGKMQIERVKK